MISFLLRQPQLDTVNNLFRRLDPDVVRRLEKLPYGELFSKSVAPTGVYIFTGLDQLSAAQKQAAAQVWSRLDGSGSVLLNHPRMALDRFDLLSRLHAEGINGFRVFRWTAFDGDEAAYPVFVRSNSQHTGPLSPLLHSRSDVEHAVQRARLWGHQDDDLLVVEYCYTQDDDGYFRKLSAYRIGKHVIPCHLEHGLTWSVKRSTSKPKFDAPELATEELQFIEDNPHAVELKRIFDVAQIDYGRIDYAVREGGLQIWEINTAPSYGQAGRRRNPARDMERQARLRARTIYYGSISEALRSLDDSVVPGESPVEYDRSLTLQIRKDLRAETAVVTVQRVRNAARSIGLSRLGRVKTPLSWLLGRVLNKLG